MYNNGNTGQGASIENGSNSNGKWTKYSDGTLINICSFSQSSDNQSFTLPLPFIDSTYSGGGIMLVSPTSTTVRANASLGITYPNSNTQYNVFMQGRSGSDNMSCRTTLVGRWK
jgi:hypothetical protein